MRTLFSIFTVLIIFSLFFSCSGPKALTDVSEGNMPEWYVNHPKDPNYLAATGTAASFDLQLAETKAIDFARHELGRQLESHLKSMLKNFQEESGFSEDAQLVQQFTNASKTIVNTSIVGSETFKHQSFKDGKMWRYYVLLRYPIGEANKLMMQKIKEDENLLTKLQATKTFKELESEISNLPK